MSTFEDIEESKYNRMVEETIHEACQDKDKDKLFGISLKGHVEKVAAILGVTLAPERIEEIAIEARQRYQTEMMIHSKLALEEAIGESVSFMEIYIEKAVRGQQ